MSIASIATAEHPEDAAALDHEFAASPPRDDREGIWPLDTVKGERGQGAAKKDGQADKKIKGDIFKTQKLASGKDVSRVGGHHA
ncbi:hypothetical protein Daus18300_004998 [Diaporthe australafricana]|uniref:Uncharacterized protein n=1 Tax=Diaporthe australafricana TaxID=127596 RepID=A0ABR3X424_9PEZI